MLQIYKIIKASSGGGRLCLDPPEGIKLCRRNNSFTPLPRSLPRTTCQNYKSQGAAANLLLLGSDSHGGFRISSPPSLASATPAAWREINEQQASVECQRLLFNWSRSVGQIVPLCLPPGVPGSVHLPLQNMAVTSLSISCDASTELCPLLAQSVPCSQPALTRQLFSARNPRRLELRAQCQPAAPLRAVLQLTGACESCRLQTAFPCSNSSTYLLLLFYPKLLLHN